MALAGAGTGQAAAGQAWPDAPGTVIRTEDISTVPDAGLRGAVAVHRITYISVGATGGPVETQANVYVPARTREDGTVRLMAYNHGTVGLGPECGVGLRLGTGGGYDDWLGPWLEEGYALVVPEYAGIGQDGDAVGHAYNHGEIAAKNSVDAVRAARAVYPVLTGQELVPGFVTDGGSQGAHTSVWVNRIIEDYAPDETLVGSSAGSLPADIGGYVSFLSPGIPAVPQVTGQLVTYVSYLLAGMDNAGTGIAGSPVFTDRARSLVAAGQDLCYQDMVDRSSGVAPGDLVTRPLAGTPELARLRADTAIPDSGFSAPILVQQGDLDVVTPRAQVDPWVSRVRGTGAEVELRTYPTQGHGLSATAEANALAWSEEQAWPL